MRLFRAYFILLPTDQDSASDPSAYNFRNGMVGVWECGQEGYSSSASYCCESKGEGSRCCSTTSALFKLGPASTGNPSSSTMFISSSPSSASLASTSSQPSVASPTSVPPMPPAIAGHKTPIGTIVGGFTAGLAFFLVVGAGVLCLWKKGRDTGVRIRNPDWMKPELAGSVVDEPASGRDESGDNMTDHDLPTTTRVPSELIADHGISELPVPPSLS